MKLQKKKTNEKEVWDIMLDDKRIGKVFPVYKTRTQKHGVAQVTVKDYDLNEHVTIETSGRSLRVAMLNMEQELEDRNIIVPESGTVEPIDDLVKDVAAGDAPAMADLVGEVKRNPQAGSTLD